ncbi:leucine-rich repeat domain-containing protein [Wukongibacter sp. M2B1]|uniref:leucine-rich repeat domain-containing protein n=1 Tax=Wukongibacter sp. M2B1 TaxID=3088895 RepID=UPI003D7A677B
MKILKTIIVVLVTFIFTYTCVIADEVPLGTEIGIFTTSNDIIYINDQRVQGYTVENEVAICIEDLIHCGFDGNWDSVLRESTLEYNGNKKSSNSNKIIKSKIDGNSIVRTDVKIYLDGDRIKAYSTGEYSLVKIIDLIDFAKIEKGKTVNITINDETLNKPDIVIFKDKQLQQMVRQKLNRPYGRLFMKSLIGIESISEDETKQIENLEGIENLTNLKELKLSSVIRPEDGELLKKLSNLKSIKLGRESGYGLEFLKELKVLEDLEIETVWSVKTIGELTNLRKLSLRTKARDISSLSNLKKLEELTLDSYSSESPELGKRKPDIGKALLELDNLRKLKLYVTPLDLVSGKYLGIKELDFLDDFELLLNVRDNYSYSYNDLSDDVRNLTNLKEFTNVTKLSVYEKKEGTNKIAVRSIKGLEHLKNLKELDIDAEYLWLMDNNSPLKELRHLERLYLNNQYIDNLEYFKDMSELKELYILNNRKEIGDLNILGNFESLETLKLSFAKGININNKPLNISSLANLHMLENIELTGCKVDDISWIEELKNLKTISLANNNIVDISPVAGLSNAEEINLEYNRIIDIYPIIDKKKLKRLDVSYNDGLIIPIDFYLPNLEVLEWEGNDINNVTFNQKMLRLKKLNLSCNNLETIKGIENISNVEELDLDGNNISDLDFLAGMVNLKVLSLNHNKIEDINPLMNLTYLESLDIGENKIHDINPIFSLTNLKSLNLNEIMVREILGETKKSKNSRYFEDVKTSVKDFDATTDVVKIELEFYNFLQNCGFELLDESGEKTALLIAPVLGLPSGEWRSALGYKMPGDDGLGLQLFTEYSPEKMPIKVTIIADVDKQQADIYVDGELKLEKMRFDESVENIGRCVLYGNVRLKGIKKSSNE